MKVLHVTSYYYPHLGGMESAVAQMCRGLTRRGYNISLYTSRDPPGSPSLEYQDGLEIRRFGVIAKPLLNPLTRGILRAILRSDAAIVHSHDEHAFTSNLAVAGRILRDRPLILHCYGELAASSRRERTIVGLYDSTLNRFGYHVADIVIEISPAFIPYVTRKFGISAKKIRIVPNAIDPDNYYPDADPEDFRRQRNLPQGQWVLYVGALIPRKGIQTLIQVLPEIIRENPDVRLLLIGRGPLKSHLLQSISQAGISQHAFFLEGLNQHELSAAYRLARLVVLPTLADVAPNVILEAMLFRRPVVSTNILGIREFFSDAALLVEPRAGYSLKEAILRLLWDAELSLRLGEKGHRLLMNNFRREKRVDEVSKIYNSLL